MEFTRLDPCEVLRKERGKEGPGILRLLIGNPLIMKAMVKSVPDAEISGSLRQLLADVFALYLKTKNFHWHMSGRHFRDYHLLVDEHAGQIFAMTDDVAERARKIGGTTLHSISDISKHQRLTDNCEESVVPEGILKELHTDNRELTRFLGMTHELCNKHGEVATASLIENWIDQTERRTWFLSEIVRVF
jgi:starvation-inducible DNA-binding protein